MGYPDFVSDRDGLERWRAHALEGGGHDMAGANKNTLYRFVQTVDNLETALAEARRQIAEARSVLAGEFFTPADKCSQVAAILASPPTEKTLDEVMTDVACDLAEQVLAMMAPSTNGGGDA